MRLRIPKRAAPLKPLTTISTLAKSELLDLLDKHELVVYIRLLAATGPACSRKIEVRNRDLCEVPRTAIRAVQGLAELGLVKITFPDGPHNRRVIEVL